MKHIFKWLMKSNIAQVAVLIAVIGASYTFSFIGEKILNTQGALYVYADRMSASEDRKENAIAEFHEPQRFQVCFCYYGKDYLVFGIRLPNGEIGYTNGGDKFVLLENGKRSLCGFWLQMRSFFY
jgi:hypothetical protein